MIKFFKSLIMKKIEEHNEILTLEEEQKLFLKEIEVAENMFNNAVEPNEISTAIHKLNYANSSYNMFLKNNKLDKKRSIVSILKV